MYQTYPLSIGADEVIIRYIRVRLGDESGVDADAVSIRYNKNIILDHVSVSWSVDEAMSIYHNENVTVQWCLLAESLYEPTMLKVIMGLEEFGDQTIVLTIIICWRITPAEIPVSLRDAANTDYRNNVLYNWGYQSCYGGEKQQQGNPQFNFTRINMVASYYKPGSATRPGEGSYRIVEPSTRNGTADASQ